MIENEKAILGACFLDTSAVDLTLSLMSTSDFALEPHRLIFNTMISMAENRSEINLVTICTELSGKLDAVGGTAYLAELSDFVPSFSEKAVTHYCGAVKESSLKRKLKGIAEAITRNIDNLKADELKAKTEEALITLGESKTEGPTHVKNTLKDVTKQIEQAQQNRGRITGLPSGIEKLDSLLCGFNNSDLTIVAARPSMGKSAFAGNVVENISVKGDRGSLIFSCEMSREQWVKRILYSLARVDGSRARVGNFYESDWPKMTKGMEQLHQSKVWIDDAPGIHINELKARARRLARKEDIGLIVIDYLQLMTGEGNSRQQEIGSISRGLKGLAKELNIPVIALSQLNRKLEERTNKRPVMADLRESGDIEQDADNIIFLYRDCVYNEDADEHAAEIIVGKQRNGPIGLVHAHWVGGYSRFENKEDRRYAE